MDSRFRPRHVSSSEAMQESKQSSTALECCCKAKPCARIDGIRRQLDGADGKTYCCKRTSLMFGWCPYDYSRASRFSSILGTDDPCYPDPPVDLTAELDLVAEDPVDIIDLRQDTENTRASHQDAENTKDLHRSDSLVDSPICLEWGCGMPGNEWMCKDADVGPLCERCAACRKLTYTHAAATTAECDIYLQEWEALSGMTVEPAKDDNDCFYHSLARLVGKYCTPDGVCEGIKDLRDMLADSLTTIIPDVLSNAAAAEESKDADLFINKYVEGVRTNAWGSDIEMIAVGRILDADVKYVSLDMGDWSEGPSFGLTRVEPGESQGSKREYVLVSCNHHWMPARKVGAASSAALKSDAVHGAATNRRDSVSASLYGEALDTLDLNEGPSNELDDDGFERRLDLDGNLYTLAEFKREYGEYGGPIEWAAAIRQPEMQVPRSANQAIPQGKFGVPVHRAGASKGTPLKDAAVNHTAVDDTATNFAAFYGEALTGLASTGKSSVAQEDKRFDVDGKLYTRAEFVHEYGGTKEWDEAATPLPGYMEAAWHDAMTP